MAAVFGVLIASASESNAADVTVFSAGAIQPAVKALLPDVLARTGHRANFTFGPVGPTRARVVGSAPGDIVILPPAALKDLVGQSVVKPSRYDLWRVGIGIAVREAAPQPSLDSPEAFRLALVEATGVYHSDPTLTSSAAYLAKLLEQLGLAEMVRAKAHVYPRSEDALDELGKSEGRALAVAPVPEILAAQHVTLAGPLPPAYQSYTLYAGAVLTRSAQPEAAEAVLRFLASPEHLARVRSLGFERSE